MPKIVGYQNGLGWIESILPATPVGGIQAIPSGFTFPSVSEYATKTASAIQDVSSFPVADMAQVFTPPGKTSAAAIKTLIESAAGGSISQLAVGALGPSVPPKVASMLTNVLDGAVSIVVENVTKSIGDVLGDAAGPVVGMMAKIVGAIVDMIVSIATSAETEAIAQAEARKAAKNAFIDCCKGQRNIVSACDAIPTGVDSDGALVVTPADTFRTIAYGVYGKAAMPWCSPMSFLWLCGGETQGATFTRARYQAILASERSRQGDPKLGIPQEVQRRMWSLIKGICASVQNPLSEQAIVGDQGRSLMPLLVDLVYQHWQYPNRSRALPVNGHWNEGLLRALASDQSLYCTVKGYAGNATASYSGRCLEVVDIVGSPDGAVGFLGMLRGYQTQLRHKFGTADGTLTANLSDADKAAWWAIKKKAMIVLSESEAKGLADALGGLETMSGPKVAALTAAVAVGYLGYEGYAALRKRGAKR